LKDLTKHACLATFLWLHALPLPGALAEEGPRYAAVRTSPDGIGKVYLGREIAQVMSFHGAPWLERPERLEEERPDRVLAALELKPGMTVADIGAGSGYYSWRMAERVGASGTVYAVDPTRNDRAAATTDDAARYRQRQSHPRRHPRSAPARRLARPRADG